MVWMLTLTAMAGPVPMFGRAPRPVAAPVAPVAIAPTSANTVFVPFPVIVGSTTVVDPAPVIPEAPEEAFPARLPFVEAEPVKTKVDNPGQMTPIDELPSAFAPIPQAVNHLPKVSVRQVITIEPPSTP
ncbi:MAG: hypothetical protein AAF211_32100 [Myxococcota bacterium]